MLHGTVLNREVSGGLFIMKLDHRGLETSVWTQLLLGSAVVAGLGCGAAEPGGELGPSTNSDAVADLSQELRGRGHRGLRQREHRRGFWRDRQHTPPASPPPVAACGLRDSDAVFAAVNADVTTIDADDRPFTRYFDLGDRARALGCGRALDGERAALNKLINSTSIDPTISPALAIDADETLYRIDLRDYQWDRSVSVAGDDFADAWEALIAATPYAVEFVGDDADSAKSATQTSVPVLFGSAFVAAAARAPLYYALLDIPADVAELLSDELLVDVQNDPSVRAGFSAAALGGERDFLAERFDLGVRAGYVWQVSDFAGDLFDDPLGAASGERELSFTLPNGLLAHVLADGSGDVVSTSTVLIDAAESDSRARIATSLLASRARGVELTDQVRGFVLANPGNFNAAERAEILALYPAAGELQQLLDFDRDAFVARALQAINLDIEAEPEPISQSFRDFSAPVDAATAAAELFVSTEQLVQELRLLDPSLESLASGGTVSREVFTAAYRSSLCILGVVLENQVAPGLCQ